MKCKTMLESSENQAQFTQVEANQDLQAAGSTKHSSLLVNNINGKTSEEDYWILFEISRETSTEHSEVYFQYYMLLIVT